MSSYNLSDNVNDSFEFTIRGKKYTMRYPRMGELEDIQALTEEADVNASNPERTRELNEKMLNSLYSFITPIDHEVSIKDTLKGENIKVLQNFNLMIKTELSA